MVLLQTPQGELVHHTSRNIGKGSSRRDLQVKQFRLMLVFSWTIYLWGGRRDELGSVWQRVL